MHGVHHGVAGEEDEGPAAAALFVQHFNDPIVLAAAIVALLIVTLLANTIAVLLRQRYERAW